MRRGILGGTFDPPHVAHLFAAEVAYRDLGLDVVTFVPAGAPWQKAGTGVSAAHHRWEMTRLAVAGIPYFEADDREVRREGWTYTVDTLGELTGDLFLILGSDAAAGLPTWHRFDDVAAMADIVVAPRPGVDRDAVRAALGEAFHWLDMPALEVSGTALRRRVSNGKSVRFLVPDDVARYIAEHRLYRGVEPAESA